jgi:hypothetical protein
MWQSDFCKPQVLCSVSGASRSLRRLFVGQASLGRSGLKTFFILSFGHRLNASTTQKMHSKSVVRYIIVTFS